MALQVWLDAAAQELSSSGGEDLLESRVLAAQMRVQELTAACEEQALRGSADHYSARAELEWEYSHAKDLARLLGLPADTVPDNVYRLVSVDSLKGFHAWWLDTKRALEVSRATAPPGTHAAAIERADKQLRALDEALQLGPVDLAARFSSASGSVFTQAAPWLTAQEQARESEIRRREAQLLQEALARDGTDVQALVRLNELAQHEPVDVRQADRRATVLERFELTTEPSRSRLVRETIRDRIMDPVAAAWKESQLMESYLADGAAVPFGEWMASQLDPGDLVEVAAWVEGTQALVRHGLSPASLAHRDLDLRVLDVESREVLRSFSRRTETREAPSTGAPAALTAAVPIPSRPDIDRLDPEDQRLFWEALERLGARTQLAPGAIQLRHHLALNGYEQAVDGLLSDLDSLQSHPLGRGLRFDCGIDPTEGQIFQAAARVRSGILPLYGSDPEKARSLLERLETLRTQIRYVPPPLLFVRPIDGLEAGLGSVRPTRASVAPRSPEWPSEGLAPASQNWWQAWGRPLSQPSAAPSDSLTAARPFDDQFVEKAREAAQGLVAKIEAPLAFERLKQRQEAELERHLRELSEQQRQRRIEEYLTRQHQIEMQRRRIEPREPRELRIP